MASRAVQGTTSAVRAPAAAFALGLTVATAGLQCTATPSPSSASGVGVAGGEAGAAAGGALADAAGARNMGDEGGPAAGDAGASPDTSSQATEPGDGGVTAATDAAAPPVWATWPMPNAPSSGLPNPQSYDTSTAGVALDRVTGLTWQRDVNVLSTAQSAPAGSTLADATTACSELDLAGFHDWRVPSRIELVSLLDFTRFPALDTSVFTPTPSFLLSSSVHGSATVGYVWTGDGASSAGGQVGYLDIAALPSGPLPADGGPPPTPLGDVQGPDAVRCVRGQASADGPHYTIAGGTVHDNWTGLTWIQSPSSSAMLPSDVPGYCTAQTLDGGGWRAPSANELETLWGDFYDPDAVTVDPTAFGGVDAGVHVGTSNVSVRESDAGPAQWIYVVNDAYTGSQDDVSPTLFPLPGAEPTVEYWAYALCVR